MNDLEQRLARVEALLEVQRAVIEAQAKEIADLQTGIAPPAEATGAAVSRRDLFHGIAAATLGAAATAVTAAPASAEDGAFMRYGRFGTATTRTAIVYEGSLASQDGVYGFGVTDGYLQRYYYGGAIAGHANQRFRSGVEGLAEGDAWFGVAGIARNASGVGVQGVAEGKGGSGVLGRCTQGVGVLGDSILGYGVVGKSGYDGGVGVLGTGETAVRAEAKRAFRYPDDPPAKEAVGLLATARLEDTALSVEGVFQASRSGLVVIRGGTRSVAVTVPGLRATSMVLATVQSTRTQTPAVANAVALTDRDPNRIVIRLTANAPSGGLQVAWFVVDRPPV